MGLDGKQKYESAGSGLKTDAELLLAQRRIEINAGKEPITRQRCRHYTFTDLAEKYQLFIANQKAATKKKSAILHLVQEFGTVKLENFSLSILEGWQSRWLSEPRPALKGQMTPRPPVKPATVNRSLAYMKHMFTKAFDWEMITEDVLKRVRKVKLTPENNRRLRYLSLDECQALLGACDKHLKPIVVFALNTGCRRGEILGLKWENVDLKHGFILLDDGMVKTNVRREIPINDALRATLQGIVRRLDVPYVFYKPTTIPENRCGADIGREKLPVIRARYLEVRRSFATACRKAKIKDFHFHDLRHTFASQLVMNGADIATVSRLLGHTTLTMTLRYAHLAPDHLQKTVKIIGNLLSPPLHDSLYDKEPKKGKRG
jgi:integrase